MATLAIALSVLLLWSECSATIQDHCTDISYWEEVRYETTTKQCCDTKLRQECTTKNDQICQDVLELQCEVVAWGACLSTPTTTPSTKCAVKYNDFAHQKCEEVRSSVTHTKKVPECNTITKNNCVTDWEVDANGNKVWAGTETCTPVSWEECDIVEKQVEFPTVKTECDVDSQIKWAEFVDTATNIVGFESKCEVKKAVNCKHVRVNKCAPVVWEECKMVPREVCLAKVIHTPIQDKIHQKKCLTGDKTETVPEVRVTPVNVIYPDKKLLVDLIRSTNLEYSCGMEANGNFAIKNSDGVVIWSTGTVGVGLYFEFRLDGSLSIHDQFGAIYWTAGTFGKEAKRLVLENNGFLVLYSVNGAVLWTSQPHKLLRGQTLKGGYRLVSASGVYTLTMQLGGNLVLSSSHGSVSWAIGTTGLGPGAYLQFRSDGNLVLYGAGDVAGWDATTGGSKAKALVLQDDGQLVLCCKEDGGQVWTGVGNFIREGSYEFLDGKEKSDEDFVEIKKIGENFKWTNKAGETWTLYPTAEVNVLRVGEDSPYYTSANHRTAVFNAAGVSGPFGSMFVFKGVKVGCPVALLDVSTANAINNNLVGGVIVTLSQDGKVVGQLSTDNSAKGQFNSPHGEVVLTAELHGFTMAPVHVTVRDEECDKMIKLSLSPEFSGAARVVMNWGPFPKDLDLHVLQLKAGQVVCHAFYDNKNCGGFTLDVDNRLGGDNGAETVSFSKLDADSEYMVFVYDYSVKSAPTYLPQSQARVAFYREGYTPTQISVPTQDNDPSRRWWMVACFKSGGQFVGSNRNLLMSSEPSQCSSPSSQRIREIPQFSDFKIANVYVSTRVSNRYIYQSHSVKLGSQLLH